MRPEYFDTFINILNKELVLAMGCTEPIAIAYASSVAADKLNEPVINAIVYASGNIIKNVKSVTVPHTNGLKGIEAACAVGLFFGKADKKLNCLSEVSQEQSKTVKKLMNKTSIEVKPLESDFVLDLIVEAFSKNHCVEIRITNTHTNLVSIKVDKEIVFEKDIYNDKKKIEELDYSSLLMENIFRFANEIDINEIENVISRQIEYNTAISEKGMAECYGAQIGKTLLKRDNSIRTIAKAYAASGSDARMNGCELPVVICSGSGNQGLTVSIPVIKYAEYYHKNKDELYRALLISNLVTLHLKSGIGRLSAYCGAISAGAGAGAGIAYLLSGTLDAINHTIVNALAISSGVICDGAKASCAAKISLAVDTGILGYEMYLDGMEFIDGDGIVKKGVENTIKNVSILGHDGMRETDKKIIEIMTKE